MSMDPKIGDGGAAFPWFNAENGRGETGMSLRDRFAIAALQGFIASRAQDQEWEPIWEGVSEIVYDAADAMLKARLK